MSQPNRALVWMLGFLGLIALACAALYQPLLTAFGATPIFNGVILLVFLVGVLANVRQVSRLQHEVNWITHFRRSNPERAHAPPVLLAPMAQMLARSERRPLTLNTASMRSILDSVHLRLEEQRDLSRYLVGLLIFLGLLGTFWGLLATIGSIGETIRSLDPGSGDANDVLNALKSGLSAPLSGMGTAFSSSLFGLAGSLIVGFLDLQAGRAQNRFYTELENWLSSLTDVSSDVLVADPSKAQSAEEIRVLSERLRSLQETGGSSPRVATAMANLADGISGLVKNMRNEQQLMRDWVEAQAEEQKAMRATLDKLTDALKQRERN